MKFTLEYSKSYKKMGQKHWVYVISNDAETYFYVGVTQRLFKRLYEHSKSSGALATKSYEYDKLVALYDAGYVDEITTEDRLRKEDLVTLQLMKLVPNWYKVRGGRWTTHGISKQYKSPKETREVPMPVVCDCGFPAELYGNTYMCSLRKNDWIYQFDLALYQNEPCEFRIWKDKCNVSPEPNYCLCGNLCGSFPTCYTCSRIPNTIEGIEILKKFYNSSYPRALNLQRLSAAVMRDPSKGIPLGISIGL